MVINDGLWKWMCFRLQGKKNYIMEIHFSDTVNLFCQKDYIPSESKIWWLSQGPCLCKTCLSFVPPETLLPWFLQKLFHCVGVQCHWGQPFWNILCPVPPECSHIWQTLAVVSVSCKWSLSSPFPCNLRKDPIKRKILWYLFEIVNVSGHVTCYPPWAAPEPPEPLAALWTLSVSLVSGDAPLSSVLHLSWSLKFSVDVAWNSRCTNKWWYVYLCTI